MFEAVEHNHLVPFDGNFTIDEFSTAPDSSPGKKECKELLEEVVKEIQEYQRILYAHDYHSVLLIFQALDAAGKDSTIRAVLSGVNPAGCQVFSFKQPSKEELDHDFLWRTTCRLPERGRIGVFNRSYYEDVLVVRVHPEYLRDQHVENIGFDNIWPARYEAICALEKHLAQSGTIILKFWLNISKEEQRQRFLSRLNEPEKHWKFSTTDVQERQHWDQYMYAYEEVLRHTSKPWAPWYAIPADDKPYMRMAVANTVLASIKSLKIQYPEVAESDKQRFAEMRRILEKE